jgi:hypothetical protein
MRYTICGDQCKIKMHCSLFDSWGFSSQQQETMKEVKQEALLSSDQDGATAYSLVSGIGPQS